MDGDKIVILYCGSSGIHMLIFFISPKSVWVKQFMEDKKVKIILIGLIAPITNGHAGLNSLIKKE